ncbi:hypothetical protein [Actinoplanes sp. NPDC049599]|uniref:hypothetical protein n=1 Tax=Actinoplanes sp. NPDC049599 TaxID=3363903 RepID=UPI0037B3B6C3
MSDDRERAEPDPDSRTDEELERQRQTRFGHLPARVRPEDLVETEDADVAHEEPGQPMVRREWG